MSAIMSPGSALNETWSSRTFISRRVVAVGHLEEQVPRLDLVERLARPAVGGVLLLDDLAPRRSRSARSGAASGRCRSSRRSGRGPAGPGAMRWPRTKVPLALPRSSRKSCPCRRCRSAWRLDTCGCETTMSLSGVRPMLLTVLAPLGEVELAEDGLVLLARRARAGGACARRRGRHRGAGAADRRRRDARRRGAAAAGTAAGAHGRRAALARLGAAARARRRRGGACRRRRRRHHDGARPELRPRRLREPHEELRPAPAPGRRRGWRWARSAWACPRGCASCPRRCRSSSCGR